MGELAEALQAKRSFTVVDGADQIKRVRALNEDGALTNAEESVLIIEGTFGSIGGKKVSFRKMPESIWWEDMEEEPATDKTYTLVLGDPIVIPNATYIGKQTIDNEDWLAFQKNGVRFWLWNSGIGVSRINGKSIP